MPSKYAIGTGERNCPQCGKRFIANIDHWKYCSDSCSNSAYLRRKPLTRKLDKHINLTSFEKAWEEAKENNDWHEENVEANDIMSKSPPFEHD